MKRYRPSATAQADLLTAWENRCAYCRLPFGLMVWRQGQGRWAKLRATRGYTPNFAAIALRLEWDHFVPFTYSDSCEDAQFVPACHICNGLKSDKVFRSIEGAREYLEPQWLRRYELASGPPRSWEAARLSEASDYAGA